MSKKKKVQKPVEEPKVEAAQQAEPTFAVKLEVVGAEEIFLNGVKPTVLNNIRDWFGGLGSETTEISLGDQLLILDRRKIAYLVVGPEKPFVENGVDKA